MSPLVRLLLALAALLAAVDAQYRCTTKIIGRTSPDEKELTIVDAPYRGSQLQVNNYCDPFDKHLVGERVTVCNKTPEKWDKAEITSPPCPELTPVGIYCHDPSGCKVFTTEYCDY